MEGEVISPALSVLLEIMTSTKVTEARSIEAAKAIVEYEAPPSVFEMAHKYLLWVAQDEEQDAGLRLEALNIMRKVEARRVVPGTTQVRNSDKERELAAKMAAGLERVAMRARGERPGPALVSDVEAVEGDGLAARLQRARLARR